MSAVLSREEVATLTGYVRISDQRRFLSMAGIPFREMGNRIIVLEQHVAAWVEGRPIPRYVEPDLSVVK